jgi:hypothetical protein
MHFLCFVSLYNSLPQAFVGFLDHVVLLWLFSTTTHMVWFVGKIVEVGLREGWRKRTRCCDVHLVPCGVVVYDGVNDSVWLLSMFIMKVIFIFDFSYRYNFFIVSEEYILIEHYTVLTYRYSILLLDLVHRLRDIWKHSNTTFQKPTLLPSSRKKSLSYKKWRICMVF